VHCAVSLTSAQIVLFCCASTVWYRRSPDIRNCEGSGSTWCKNTRKIGAEQSSIWGRYLASHLRTPHWACAVPFLVVRELCGSVVGFDFVMPVGGHSISAISTFVTLQIVWLSPCATSSPPTFVRGRGSFLRLLGRYHTLGITWASQSDPLRVSPRSSWYPDWKLGYRFSLVSQPDVITGLKKQKTKIENQVRFNLLPGSGAPGFTALKT
jgi:hypothetical protein